MKNNIVVHDEAPLNPVEQLVVMHEMEMKAIQLAREIQREAARLKRQLSSMKKAPYLSQVRSLNNALTPQGAKDSPALRLARLHQLVAFQLERGKEELPAPIVHGIEAADALPTSFWQYVAARLLGLRLGNGSSSGLTEQVWQTVTTRYKQRAMPATAKSTLAEKQHLIQDQIHLRLAETFVHQLCESWEYTPDAKETT